MPVLEAMASGTAVLTSNLASMPEVSAGAARLVEPTSVGSIAEGLKELLSEPDFRSSCEEKGLGVAQSYSWERSWLALRSALAEL